MPEHALKFLYVAKSFTVYSLIKIFSLKYLLKMSKEKADINPFHRSRTQVEGATHCVFTYADLDVLPVERLSLTFLFSSRCIEQVISFF